jgi:tetratricopeptide (TPR) repeat protein
MAHASEKSIFLHAASLASADERRAYLDEACAADTAMRVRIDALLTAHNRLGGDAPPTNGLESETSSPDLDIGAVLGDRFKLLEVVGEGGMGTVWMAQQSEPVRRVVAVKLIKAGMDTKGVLARFEAERQALALMDHPNIAKVHDGGVTSDGRPYFVMELVKGVPITRYCDEHHLTPRQRLELFVPVCQAIQHAHQKGIIHRDIKPSNVLVALYDDRPVPKVIDFGVAKATGPQLTEQTLHTGFGAVVGTIEYMSPEQASFNQLDVDTRSDIYSLGVLLYELLAGSPPFSKKELEKAGMLEMLRVIREQEPSKPSTKLSSSDALPSLSASRGTEPSRLTRLVRGELDWIVMKALEKDRARRYETANGFAMDVQRYLADEAVSACPPSMGYRFRKFVRRNRAAVLAAAAILFVLVAGITGTTLGLIRSEQARADEAEQRKIADAQKKQAEQARADEAEQRQIADAEKKKAQKAEADTLADYRANSNEAIEQLIGSKAELGPQEKAYLEKTLKRWQAFADRQGDDESSQAIRAEGQTRVAYLWSKLGQRDKARTGFETALDQYKKLVDISPAVPRYQQELAETHQQLGGLLKELGQPDDARTEYETSRDLRQKLTAAFPTVPDYQHDLAGSHIGLGNLFGALGQRDAARTEYDIALNLLKKLDAAFPAVPRYQQELAGTHHNLGLLLRNLGEKEAARTEYDIALNILKKLARSFPAAPRYQHDLATTRHNLGVLLGELGQRDAARMEYERARELFKKLVADFPAVPDYQHNLANSHNSVGIELMELGHRDAARAEYETARDMQKKLAAAFPNVPEYQVSLGGSYSNFGNLVRDDGQPAESLQWFDLAIRTLTPVYEQDRRTVTAKEFLRNSYMGRAKAYDRLKKHAEALKDWDQAIELDPKDPSAHIDRGTSLRGLGKMDDAVATYLKAIDVDPKCGRAHYNFALFLHDQGKLPEAIVAYRKAIEVDPKDPWAHCSLGIALSNQKEREEAIACFRKAIEVDPKHGEAHHRLGVILCDHQHDYAGAIAAFQKAIVLLPGKANQHANLGLAHRLKGDAQEAIAAYREAIRLAPTYANAYAGLAHCLTSCADLKLRDSQKALEAAQKGTELAPQSGYAWFVVGRANYRLGDWKASVAAFKKGLDLQKSPGRFDAGHWFFLAMAHWQLGDKDEARQWYDKAVESMEKQMTPSEELPRFRDEAKKLLMKLVEEKGR